MSPSILYMFCFSKHTGSDEHNNDTRTADLKQLQADMRRQMVKYHNDLLEKKKERVGDNYQGFPYVVDEDTMQEKSEQPAYVHLTDWKKYDQPMFSTKDFQKRFASQSNYKEEAFRRVCRKELRGRYQIYPFMVNAPKMAE